MTHSEDDLRRAFARAVYFHAGGGPITHNTGRMIEGCMEMQIAVKVSTDKITSRPVSMPLTSVNLSPLASQPLTGFSGYVIDISHTNAYVPFEGIQGGKLAYLNQSDINLFSRVPNPHVVFVTHEIRHASKGGTRIPIAFGMNNGLIAATENRKPMR